MARRSSAILRRVDFRSVIAIENVCAMEGQVGENVTKPREFSDHSRYFALAKVLESCTVGRFGYSVIIVKRFTISSSHREHTCLTVG